MAALPGYAGEMGGGASGAGAARDGPIGDPFAEVLGKEGPPVDPWPHAACVSDEALMEGCEFGRSRSSGPGGQNRNKVETMVILTHRATGLKAHASERRSQAENKRVAMRRLRLVLAVEVRSAVPSGSVGSRLWRSRIVGGRIRCGVEHHDFPMMLAEALDVIAAAGWDAKKAATRLGCTATQLTRFVKGHAPAMEKWNRERAARGEHPLR